MKVKCGLGLWAVVSLFQTTSAFAVAIMTCDQAKSFLDNPDYTCDLNGTDCSKDECVDTATCRYTAGYEGFSINFSYATTCNLD